nr:translation initiation factor IF-2-like [Pongo pygmaeus]
MNHRGPVRGAMIHSPPWSSRPHVPATRAAGSRCSRPEPASPKLGAGARGCRRGKGPSADSGRPSSAEAPLLPVPIRKPRASQTASASSNTFHGLPPAREPLLPRRGRGQDWKAPLWGRESSSGPSPCPPAARPRRASSPFPRAASPAAPPTGPHRGQVRQLVTPGRQAAPSRPLGSPGSRGLPPAPRKTATPETSLGRVGRGSRLDPRASPLPCSREATIRAGRAGRVVRERARVGRPSYFCVSSLLETCLVLFGV